MNKLITTIACLICCIVYTQAQNKDNMLSKKEQSIAAISMYAARGNQDSLKVILARGLDCGLTVSEEKEVLTQLYAYCGFPRSMGALVTLMNLTKERAAQGIKDDAGRPNSFSWFCPPTTNISELFTGEGSRPASSSMPIAAFHAAWVHWLR